MINLKFPPLFAQLLNLVIALSRTDAGQTSKLIRSKLGVSRIHLSKFEKNVRTEPGGVSSPRYRLQQVSVNI